MSQDLDPLTKQLIGGAPDGASIASYLLVPADIQLVLDTNTQLNPEGQLQDRFAMAIVAAVQASLRDPRAAPRVITEALIQERVQICLDVFRMGYHDMEMSAIRLIDMMESLLFFAIIEQRRAADQASAAAPRSAWKAPSEEPQPSLMPVSAIAASDARDVIEAEDIRELEVGEPETDFSATSEEMSRIAAGK